MRIFLTGASGFIGSAILSELANAGHQVVCLVRSDEGAQAVSDAGGEVHRGDLRDPDSLRREVSLADAVVHAAFDHDFANIAASSEMDRIAIKAIGEALVGTDKRFVVTSGLPPLFGRMASEDDAIPAGGHGMPRKSEQTTDSLIERGVKAMIIRMSQCHDQHKQGFATYLLDHARAKGRSAYVAEGTNRWPAVHRLDAARLYRLVLERGIVGQRYHAVSEDGIPVREVAEAIGRRLDLPVVRLEPEVSGEHFGWLDRIARMDVPASSVLTRERLGWTTGDLPGIIADIERSEMVAL